ncbi:MAG: Ig-like domain-containing protein, partial [Treponema sp.]|nr:Ig-like domain-containing protein [Treponema sp.]
MKKGKTITLVIVLFALLFAACENPAGGENSGDGGNPAVSGVTVSPAAATVAKGGTQTFTAVVAGTNSPAQTVTWSVEGAAGSGTTIDTDGVLTVALGETSGTSLTVRATSTADTGKSGTAIVTVSNETATVDSVAVSPAAVTVAKGGTHTFTAEVTGTNSPTQTVTWNVEGAADAGTAITAGGVLTVAAGETVGTTLTVRAASTLDDTKSGTATVTVSSGGGGFDPPPGLTVYMAGYTTGDDGKAPCYWVNGNRTFLPIPDTYGPDTYGIAAGITVSGSGDVYIAGSYGDDNAKPCYVRPCYWKNGMRIDLPIEAWDGGGAWAIAVSGTDVYIAGVSYEDTGYDDSG